MSQLGLFAPADIKPQTQSYQWGIKTDEEYNFEDDNAEAVIFMISGSLKFLGDYFVMKRSDAQKFCSSEKSQGKGPYGKWAFCFTTHRRDWYENRLDTFKTDDGRFSSLFEELGIELIYHIPRIEK